MRWVKGIVRNIISVTILIVVLNGCTVVKTPYFKTSYYRSSISRLDSLKSEISYSKDSIYAGFSRINITPDLDDKLDKPYKDSQNMVPIAGFGQRKTKYATGIHDSIFVKAIALRVGEQTVVIVGADLLIMPTNIIDSVTLALSKLGIQRNSLFFSATHTHSSIGGWGYGLLAKVISGKENIDIEKCLTTQIIKSVLDAIADLHLAKLGSGSFNGAPYIRNRLTGDPLHNNNDFNYLIVEQTGQRKAIIGSFSAHPTTIGRKNTLISADYPGYWQQKMESTGFDMAMFCGGSMGGQSPVGQGLEFENAKYIGEALADSLSFHMKEVTTSGKLTLSALSLKISLPKYHMRLTRNINLSSGLSKRLMPLPQNVYLQAIQINNLVWVFTPGDFSGELALSVKKLLAGKGYQAMVSGYNGSYIGYIIPSKYFYLDYSEPKSMGWFGPTMGDYTIDLIERMVNTLIWQN
jgi:Neutral/alkaline non-lysosomal ceramidase, N-terminal